MFQPAFVMDAPTSIIVRYRPMTRSTNAMGSIIEVMSMLMLPLDWLFPCFEPLGSTETWELQSAPIPFWSVILSWTL
jgi:hypothetical protein